MAESKRVQQHGDVSSNDAPFRFQQDDGGGSPGHARGRWSRARGLLLVACACVTISVCLSPGPSPAQLGLDTEEKEPYSPELFQRLALSLEHFYLDRDRIDPQALMRRALSALENAVDEIYVDDVDPETPYVSVYLNSKMTSFRVSTVDSLLPDAVNMLESLFTFIQNNYRGEMGFGDIQYAVANGFLSGLDPHTMVFSPKAFSDFSVHIEGEIYGVGMYVGTRDGKLTVIEVLPGTPAARAKFMKGDTIVKIGDESTINMSVTEAVDKIRGPLKSEVVLTVKRASADDPKKLDTLPIRVTRDKVVIKSVESKLITDWRGGGGKKSGVGYVTVRNFDKNTTPSLRTNLKRLEDENGGPLAGLILDLRGNSGGLLTQAVEMSDLFLTSGDIVVQAARSKYQHRQAAKDEGNEPTYPIVVLADRGSASGAEIVIGALQKNNRAVVLGTRTFGKGSVQQLHSLPGGAQLKITVSEYLIPGDISIQENGVVPDILAQRVILADKGEAEEFDLFEEENGMTEKDYTRHIISRYAKDEKPSYKLKYLYEPIEYDPDNDRFVSGDLRPTEDTLVVTALSLLKIMDGNSRRSSLLTRSTALDTLAGELFKEIEARLGEFGIDWSAGPGEKPTAAPDVALDLSTELVEEPSGDEEDPVPVKKVLVTAKLTNRGPQTLYRAKGMSRSDYFLYKDREFLFGKVAPGETVERQLRIRMPYFPHSRSDLMTVEVSGPDGTAFHEASTTIVLQDAGRPRFSYAANLMDAVSREPLESLSPGSDAIVRVKVTNTGDAPAHKGVVILRNKTGRQVFLQPPGRIEFEELGAGAQAEAEFRFQVRSGDPVTQYAFEVGVVDSYSGASLEHEIRIPHLDEGGSLPANLAVKPFPGGVTFEAPRITAELLGDGKEDVLVTGDDHLTLTAQIVSPTGVPFKYWVMHTTADNLTDFPDKVFFADSKGRTESGLTTSVALRDGTNLFTVVSRDKNGLEARENLVVRRTATRVTSATSKPQSR